MKTPIISTATAFIIGLGASLTAAIVEAGGNMPGGATWLVALFGAGAIAAKDLRSLMKLPPVGEGGSNGTKIPAWLLIGTLALGAVGCGLTKTGKLAGYISTREALRQNPDWRPYFVQAEHDLQVLEESEDIDYVNVLAIMDRLPIKQLKTEEATIIVTATTIIIEEAGGGSITLSDVQKAELRKFVNRLRQGIKLALAQSPAATGLQNKRYSDRTPIRVINLSPPPWRDS